MRIYYGTTVRDKRDQHKYISVVHTADIIAAQIVKAEQELPAGERSLVGRWIAHVPYAVGMTVGFSATADFASKAEALAAATERAIDDGWTTFHSIATAHAEKEKRARESGLLRYSGPQRTDLEGKSVREYIDSLEI